MTNKDGESAPEKLKGDEEKNNMKMKWNGGVDRMSAGFY